MKIYDLSGHPSLPCFILKHGGVTIMLDCALDTASTLCYIPVSLMPNEGKRDSKRFPQQNLKEVDGTFFIDAEPQFVIPDMGVINMSQIDVVLISSFNCALALPYLTEYLDFRGVIYATEPTMNFSRLLMEELVANVQKTPRSEKPSHSSSTSNPRLKDPELFGLFSGRLGDSASTKDWRRLYSAFDVRSCLSKFQVVGMNEIKEIPGGLQVQAISSGFCIGGCNWLISSSYHKFGYVSWSSVLMTHARPMESSPLKSCDAMILNCLSLRPLTNPDTYVKEFCTTAAMTLKNGGNVLVPCSVVGVLYDLVECLNKHLESTGQGNTPLYCISPVAKSCLAYSNIYAEWLSTSKMARVYLPESPFPHAELMRVQRLQTYPSVHDGFSKEVCHPCVVFTSHTSLRFGDAVDLIQSWNSTPLNSIIITDPGYNYADVLAPFMPLVMRVYHCPIDTGMSFYEANNFLKETGPKHLIVPEKYLTSTKIGTYIDPEFSAIPTNRLEITKLKMKREFQKVHMTTELANSLTPIEIQPGVGVGMVAGSMSCRDSRFALKPIELLSVPQKEGKNSNVVPIFKPKMTFGTLNVMDFSRRLKQKNFVVRTEDLGNGNFIIELPNEDALLQVENGSTTHVICNNEKVRVILRDVLLECLSTIS